MMKENINIYEKLQSTSLFWDTYIVFGTVDIFVISQPKWLKFGLQAHFLKVFGHTKFQLSISYTFKVMRLLDDVFSDFHLKLHSSVSTADRELIFCMSKHLQKNVPGDQISDISVEK